ncbi:MAG: STAS domain-containing protein [Proteobacteria bacterium]|nr:STAS domain-containing protein [Pseudomonadota bacterium]
MVKFSRNGSSLTCTPQDEMIATNVPEMRDLLVAQIDSDPSWTDLVLDCINVKTLDSIGVNLIVGLFKKAEAGNKIFRVSGCNSSLEKVLKLFRLDDKFEIKTVGSDN